MLKAIFGGKSGPGNRVARTAFAHVSAIALFVFLAVTVRAAALLGLDPSDPASQMRFDGIGVTGGTVELSLRAGDRPLPQDAPFALQGKAEVPDVWRDLDGVVRLPGLWTVPISSNCLFRAVLRW